MATAKAPTNTIFDKGMAHRIDQLIDVNGVAVDVDQITANQSVTVAGSGARTTGTVAAAGTVVGNATAVAHDNEIVTAGDATTGVKLPLAVKGMEINLVNFGSTGTLKVYGQGNNTINAIAAGTPIVVGNHTAATFIAGTGGDTGAWYTLPTVPS